MNFYTCGEAMFSGGLASLLPLLQKLTKGLIAAKTKIATNHQILTFSNKFQPQIILIPFTMTKINAIDDNLTHPMSQ